MPTPDGAGPQRHLRRLPQAAHQGGRLPPVPARPGREPRRGGPPRREDGRPLAERRTARARARPATTPSSASDPRRNNDFGFGDDPRGFKCPVGAHARRANPRDAFDQDGSVDVRLHRMIRRGTSYGPMLPDGVLEDDGVDRGIIFVFAGAHLQAAVRVRQDPVAQRRHLHRRPAEKDPLVGPNDEPGQLHHPAAPDPPPAAGPAAVRGHPRRRVLLRPGPDARCAGWRSWTHDRPDRPERHDMAELTRHRPLGSTRLRRHPPPTSRRPSRRCSSTTCPTAGSP